MRLPSSLRPLAFLTIVTIGNASVIDAIAVVESGTNHRAVGDSGKALGAWQMHAPAWRDAAKRLGVDWPHTDAHDPRKARKIAAEHLRWLEAQFTRRTGRRPSASDSYALWNLGVGGYAKRDWKLASCPRITQRAVQKIGALMH